ncbi:hypothetical protein [Erythrobacter ani]|uniref:Spore coat protein U domain-containing protein n=1 Tax=Erythrobacter ani TaxID=2827235 RepID=A0ABS6SNR9_9SPHN|nr:hypothetical protein [Erythrobacter ani]MBV7266289.1 hypothetical protein [Erythrobacter ani]
MRTINKALLAAAIPAIAIAAPAHAQAGGTQITGVVPPVCEVQDGFAAFVFPSMTAGETITDNLTLKCNDADGAEVTLISSEGGMESDDQEDLEIEYTATLTSDAIDGGSLSLVLPVGVQGDNDASATGFASGGLDLASGVAGVLEVELTETAVWAGGYSDTITVQLTAS